MINTSDFTDGLLTGTITLGGGGTATFLKTLSSDGSTEGIEKFYVNLRTGSANGPIVAKTELITVNDTSITDQLYSFTSFTFTNGNGSGRTGPTSFASISSYTTQSWYSTYFSLLNGIQYWTAPVTGTYRIRAAGAAGYAGYFSDRCAGIVIQSDITLERGVQYKILVGQRGVINNGSTSQSGGGGGGTFMTTLANSPIIVAGGGGGALDGSATFYSGSNGQSGTSGSNSSDALGTGGSNGQGGSGAILGSGSRWGGGGGGLNTNGTNAASNSVGLGYAFVNGGEGGLSNTTAVGGFGGGGGTHGNKGGGGGGGGYSGGGGSGEVSSGTSGGGGGSYSLSSISVLGLNSQGTTYGTATGDGYLTITKL